jgi:hypothetical protein
MIHHIKGFFEADECSASHSSARKEVMDHGDIGKGGITTTEAGLSAMQFGLTGLIKVADEEESLEELAMHTNQSNGSNFADIPWIIQTFGQEVDVAQVPSRWDGAGAEAEIKDTTKELLGEMRAKGLDESHVDAIAAASLIGVLSAISLTSASVKKGNPFDGVQMSSSSSWSNNREAVYRSFKTEETSVMASVPVRCASGDGTTIQVTSKLMDKSVMRGTPTTLLRADSVAGR